MRSLYLSSYEPMRRPRHSRWFVYAGTVELGFMTVTAGPTYDWAEPSMNGLPLVWAGYYEPEKADLVKLGIDELDDPYEEP